MNPDSIILITGGAGLAGKNLAAYLGAQGYQHVLTPDRTACDLTDLSATQAYFETHKPTHVFHMAGYVNGLMGNMQNQGEAWFKNTQINTNVVESCRIVGVQKIVAMGTVAMYPDPFPCNPLREDVIWQGAPHASEYGYAMAKRGMLAQLDVYRANYNLPFVMALSTNLYGPFDRFNTQTGHVIPSLVKKFYDAQKTGGDVVIWGNGQAQRDFLYIEDAVRALVLMMDKGEGLINMATGHTHSIRDAVSILADLTQTQDRVRWDASMPNGQLTRAYDVSRLTALDFAPAFSLQDGLQKTMEWYAAHAASARTE